MSEALCTGSVERGRAADPGPRTPRSFRPDIEGLRAVAVIAVVLDHAGLAFPGGYVGVDVFFVISGFLITRQLYGALADSGRVSLARFYARRARRILPVATLVIVATLLAAREWTAPLEIHSVGLDAIASALFYVNVRLAVIGTNYFANPAPSPFRQYWSLAVEEQFYVLWPLLLGGSVWAARRFAGSRTAVSALLVVVIAVSFWFSVTRTASSPSWAYFGLLPRAWELALGALIAVHAESIAQALRRVAAVASWAGLSAIVLSAVWFGAATSYPGSAVALPVCGAALLIAAGGSAPRFGAEALLGLRVSRYVGRISYSWYLWHWPVLIFLPAALGHNPSKGDVVLAVLGSFVLAAASAAVVERPIRKNERLVDRPLRGLSLGAVMMGVSVLCAVLVMSLAVIPGAGAATVGAPRATPATGAVLVSAPAPAAPGVAAATRLKALPPTLSPPLADVPNDTPYTCIDSPSASAPQSVCTLGDQSATRTVVLFGDSHAWQWTQALAAVATQRDWKLVTYTKGGCPVEDVSAAVPASVVGSTNCTQWRDAVIAQLSTLRPSLVIMSSQTKGFGTAKDMTETVDAVKAGGAKVVWLEDTPYPGFDVPDCLSAHPTNIQKCSYSLTTGLYEPQTRTALNQAAARGGATLINPAPWLCTAKVCPPVIDGTVAYFDESHLSSTYAMMLVPELSAALAGSMAGTTAPA